MFFIFNAFSVHALMLFSKTLQDHVIDVKHLTKNVLVSLLL